MNSHLILQSVGRTAQLSCPEVRAQISHVLRPHVQRSEVIAILPRGWTTQQSSRGSEIGTYSYHLKDQTTYIIMMSRGRTAQSDVQTSNCIVILLRGWTTQQTGTGVGTHSYPLGGQTTQLSCPEAAPHSYHLHSSHRIIMLSRGLTSQAYILSGGQSAYLARPETGSNTYPV